MPHYNAGMPKSDHSKLFAMPFSEVYPYLLAKLNKTDTDLELFFLNAPKPNPNRKLITGIVCGERVEDISDPAWQEVRYMDKLVDELARGKKMDKVLRSEAKA